MQNDFTIATKNSALLRNDGFMDAMHRIGGSVANLIAESPERQALFDAYAKEHNVEQTARVQAEGMLHYGDMPCVANGEYDPTAVSQMMRLLMKETALSAAIQSGAITFTDLANIGIQEGVITKASIDALGHMGASTLAAVAALNLK